MCTLRIPTICTIDTVTKVVGRIKQCHDFLANNYGCTDIPRDYTKHHHQCPLFYHPPSTPPLSTVNPAHVITHVIAHVVTCHHHPHCPPPLSAINSHRLAQVITHHHCCCRRPPPSSMSSEDNAAFPPPPLLPTPPPHQTDDVNKIISMQSANKYAGQNSMFALFCYQSEVGLSAPS